MAMVNIVRQTMSRCDEARHLLRSLYTTKADIQPNHEKKKLIVHCPPASARQPLQRCHDKKFMPGTKCNPHTIPRHEFTAGLQNSIVTKSPEIRWSDLRPF